MGLRYGTSTAACSSPTVYYSQDSSLCTQSFVMKLGEVQIVDVIFNDGMGCSPCVSYNPVEFDILEIGTLTTSPKVKFSNGILSTTIIKQGVALSDHLDGVIKLSISAADFNLMADEKYEISLSARISDGRVLRQSFFIKLIHPDSAVYGGSGIGTGIIEDAANLTGGAGLNVIGNENDLEVNLDIAELPVAPPCEENPQLSGAIDIEDLPQAPECL